MSAPEILCPMPLHVDRMPLSWLCLKSGFDEVTGFRIWGEHSRRAVVRVSLRRSGIVGDRNGYVVEASCGGEWDELAFLPIDKGECAVDARDRAMAYAESEEAWAFNAAQPDPREVTA